MHKSSSILMTLLGACIALSSVGCKKQHTSAPSAKTESIIEARMDGPILSATQVISQHVEVVVVLRSPNAMLNMIEGVAGDDGKLLLPVFSETYSDFKEDSGFDLADRGFWESMGADLDAPAFLTGMGYYGGLDFDDPVLFVKISDRDKFISFMSDLLDAYEHVDQGDRIVFDDGETTAHMCGEMFMLSYTDEANMFCKNLGRIKSPSLSASEPFRAYVRDVLKEDAPIGIYGAPRGELYEEVLEELGDFSYELTPTGYGMDEIKLARLAASVTGYGTSLFVEEKAWRMRSWIGLTPGHVTSARDVFLSSRPLALADTITRDVQVASIIHIDGIALWHRYLGLLTGYGELELEYFFEEIEGEVGVDLEPERDLLSGHDGNLLIAIYADESVDDIEPLFPLFMTTYRSEEDIQRIWGVVTRLIEGEELEVRESVVKINEERSYKTMAFGEDAPFMLASHGTRIVAMRPNTPIEFVAAAFFGPAGENQRILKEARETLSGEMQMLIRGEALSEILSDMIMLEDEQGISLLPTSSWTHATIIDSGIRFQTYATPLSTPEDVSPLTEKLAANEIVKEGDTLVIRIANGAARYFKSEQTYRAPGSSVEPWHPSDSSDELKASGYPIDFEEYVFPGGKNFTMTTTANIPSSGKKEPLALPSDARSQAAIAALGLGLDGEQRWRLTYSTGPGSGADATLTIKAERDFDPQREEAHTVVYEVTVDEDQEVLITQIALDYEGS